MPYIKFETSQSTRMGVVIREREIFRQSQEVHILEVNLFFNLSVNVTDVLTLYIYIIHIYLYIGRKVNSYQI